MKNILVILILLSITLISCENEKVVAPAAGYDIQLLNAVTNNYETLSRPYLLDVNMEYRVVSQNSGEYNSFYTGDSALVNGKPIYYSYSSQPKSNHKGISLVFNEELNQSIGMIKYPVGGVFKATFVSAAVGNEGNDVDFNVDSLNFVSVFPIIKTSSEKGTVASGTGLAIYAFDGSINSKWLCNATTGWIQVQIKTATVYHSYSLLTAIDQPKRDPKSWTISGSNDGITWTPLDTQTDVVALDTRKTKRQFAILGNTTAYNYFKLDVTQNQGDLTSLQVGEIYLEE